MSDLSRLDLDQIQNTEFWRNLCPKLTVDESPMIDRFATLSRNLDEETWPLCKTLAREDGYFVYEQWFDSDWIGRLAEGFEILDQRGIHPVFAFVFDEFWQVLLQLRPLLEDLLGEFESLPAVWSWFVKPSNQTAFPPHRDQVREVLLEDEDHLDYLTIWIPLTDLNHLSSYMCVLPASLDPDFEEGVSDIRVENLQDVRALQGRRGSVFCWSTQVAHWGTTQAEHGEPRMSVGYYVQRREVPCLDGPPLDFAKPLTLNERLAIIGQQIIDYSRTATSEELTFAHGLVTLVEAK